MKKVLCLFLACLALLPSFVLAASGAATSVSRPTVVGTHVSMGEDLSVHFYIRVPKGGGNVRASVGGVTYTGVATEEEGLYIVTYPHLPLTEMTAELEVIPSCRLNNKAQKGTSFYFSARDYAMRLLADGTATPELRRVLLAMLNYGAATQVYNSYRVSNLANDYLAPADKETVGRDYTSVLHMEEPIPGQEAEIISASMVIGSTAGFKFYLNVAGQEILRTNGGSGYPEWSSLSQSAEAAELVKNMTLEVADNPAFENASSFPLVKVSEIEGYRVLTDGIYAAEYDRTYYIRARTPAGVSAVTTYSVETYVARSLDAGLDENGRRMVLSMMEYGDAVRAYRDAIAEKAP